jgi:hypothetical protein
VEWCEPATPMTLRALQGIMVASTAGMTKIMEIFILKIVRRFDDGGDLF